MKNISIMSFLVLLVGAVLQGCGSGGGPKDIGKIVDKEVGDAVASTKDQPAPADEKLWDQIKKAGVIKWGADADSGAPFVYKENDKTIGFEVEMMEKLASHLGVKQEMVQGAWEMLPDQLASKRCDIVVNGYEINDERKNKYDFSDVYYEYEQQLAVRAEDKDKYKSIADLKGHKVGTLKGAEANNVLKRAGFTDEQLVPLADSDTPYKDLELKRTDGVVQENIITAFYAGKNEKIYLVPQLFAAGQYGILVRKGNPDLLKALNKAISEMMANGELAAIYKKWNMMNDRQKKIGVVEK